MRIASLASGLLVLLGGLAQAAEGDGLVVTGEGVNVRAGPQSGAMVLLQVHLNEPAIELARAGEWVRVRLPDQDAEGWIHSSLLAPSNIAPLRSGTGAQAAPATGGQPAVTEPPGTAQPAAQTVAAASLERFRESVDYLNTRALAAAGVDLFTDVRMAGEGVAQITATEAWGVVPEGGRQSYLNALYDRWLATVGSPLASLQIVDESGQVLSERSGP
jgi:Bacterial SH3 domain